MLFEKFEMESSMGSSISVAALFYNPNIHPLDEFNKRKEGAVFVAERYCVPMFVYNDCEQDRWLKMGEASGNNASESEAYGDTPQPGRHQAKPVPAQRENQPAGQGRRAVKGPCNMCYSTRLGFVAKKARDEGYGAFTTTLLISPYQGHELIKTIGGKCAQENGVEFYYEDFRQRFREGQGLAKGMGVYRQKYCGCIISNYYD